MEQHPQIRWVGFSSKHLWKTFPVESKVPNPDLCEQAQRRARRFYLAVSATFLDWWKEWELEKIAVYLEAQENWAALLSARDGHKLKRNPVWLQRESAGVGGLELAVQ